MHHQTRVSSPLRSPSFEVAFLASTSKTSTMMSQVAIATSPPLSPVHSPADLLSQVATMTRAPIAEQESTSLEDEERSAGPPPASPAVQEEADVVQEELDVENKRLPTQRHIVFPIAPFYQRKGSCSKCSFWLGILCAAFFLLSIALFLVWVITTDGFRTIGKASSVCSTKQCIDLAFRLSSNIDDSVQPCENFYRFSCGKFHAQSLDQQRNFVFEQKEAALRTLHGLLGNESALNSTRSATLARNLYASCMNAIQRATNAPFDLLLLLRNFPCGPLLDGCQNFNADTYSWERHAGMLDWYSGDYDLIVYDRDVHPQDRTRLILQLRPPNLAGIIGGVKAELLQLARPSVTEIEPLLQLSIRQNILNEFVRIQLLRDPRDVQAQLDEVAQLMVDLDSAANISARSTPNTTYMTFRQFFDALPQLNMREFLNAGLTTLYQWTEEDTISIQDFEYFARLVNIMANTSRRAVANYLLTVVALNLRQYSYLPREQFSWRECVEQLSQLDIAAKLYIQQNTRVDTLKVSQFVQSLKTDFISTHRSTPLQYLSSINRLGFFVGFPRRLLNEDAVWMPLSQLSVNYTDYFNSIVRVMKEERNFAMTQLGTYLDSDDAPNFPILTSTMTYDPHLGAIVLPLSFLQAPVYVPGDEVPMYAVFSSLGITVLQMIAKIFWQGINQNSQLQCFDNVFRGFLNAERQNTPNLDNDLTYTIELADAFKTMYFGYAKWQSDHSVHHEKTLPAYDKVDSIHSLIVTFSTMFCSVEGQEPGGEYEAMMNTVVSNSRQFSINFQCSNLSRIFNRRTCI